MNFLYISYLVCAAVLFIFAGNCVAIFPSDVSEIIEVEKLASSQKYQNMLDEIIMSSSDKDSIAARATIEGIRKELSKRLLDGVSDEAVKGIADSILHAVRVISTAERMANNTFNAAMNLTAQDPKAATEAVKKSLKFIKEYIITTGVPIEDRFGSDLAVSGGADIKKLLKGMRSMQRAGTAILQSLKIAEQIVSSAIEAGGSAAPAGFKAGQEAIATGGSAAFEYLFEGAENILAASSNPASNVLNQANPIPAIIQSLTSQVSTNDPDGLAAIDSLNNSLKVMLSSSTSERAKDAAQILIQSLISTILETADAIDVAKKALKEAEKLGSQDTETAVATVLRGIAVAKDKLEAASSPGFLGFGAARQIAGGITIDGLISAMFELIDGRVTAYDDLELAAETALMALRAGGPAIAQGINAAIQICVASGAALYAQFVESGKNGLEVFQRN